MGFQPTVEASAIERWTLDVEHWTFRGMAKDQEREISVVGVANPAVIDLFALDQKTGEVLLAMNEPRPWDGSDERLHELQEKFNAYVSFLLDGEMIAAHPDDEDTQLIAWLARGRGVETAYMSLTRPRTRGLAVAERRAR